MLKSFNIKRLKCKNKTRKSRSKNTKNRLKIDIKTSNFANDRC